MFQPDVAIKPSTAIYNPLINSSEETSNDQTVSIAINALEEIENVEPSPMHTRIITRISDAIQSVRIMERTEFRLRLLGAFFIVALPTAIILDRIQGRPFLPDP